MSPLVDAVPVGRSRRLRLALLGTPCRLGSTSGPPFFLIAYLFFLRLDFYLGIILVFLKWISWASLQMVMFFSSLLICQIIKWIKFLNISLFLE